MRHTKEITYEQLRKKVIPSFRCYTGIVLALCMIIGIGGWWCDTYYTRTIACSKYILWNKVLYLFKWLNTILESCLKDICSYIFTLSTVIAAVIVLYYTMQDSHREGTPRRKIVAYCVGSKTIVSMFAVENVVMLLLACCVSGKHYLGILGLALSALGLQGYILFIIFFSLSSEFCRRQITKCEDKQFQCLMEYSFESRKYIWNYFVHHMPQVISGDDMIFDKAILVGMLLNVPIAYKNKRIRKQKWNDYKEEKWKLLLYEYFFRNLVMSFGYLKEKEEDCNQVFVTIYEFIENIQHEENELNDIDYLLIVSAVMNAAHVSYLPRAEAFCSHILNSCIMDALYNRQILLYVLFLEHLSRTEAEKVRIKEFVTIRKTGAWKLTLEEKELCIMFWYIWSMQSNIPVKRNLIYINEALRGLEGEKGVSKIIDYCMYMMNR